MCMAWLNIIWAAKAVALATLTESARRWRRNCKQRRQWEERKANYSMIVSQNISSSIYQFNGIWFTIHYSAVLCTPSSHCCHAAGTQHLVISWSFHDYVNQTAGHLNTSYNLKNNNHGCMNEIDLLHTALVVPELRRCRVEMSNQFSTFKSIRSQ